MSMVSARQRALKWKFSDGMKKLKKDSKENMRRRIKKNEPNLLTKLVKLKQIHCYHVKQRSH